MVVVQRKTLDTMHDSNNNNKMDENGRNGIPHWNLDVDALFECSLLTETKETNGFLQSLEIKKVTFLAVRSLSTVV